MSSSFRTIAEMKEFATFSPAAQRYIRRSLDVSAMPERAVAVWARSSQEEAEIRTQARLYDRLAEIRMLVPEVADNFAAEPLIALLLPLSSHDLAQAKMVTFGSYRFLYERLLGTPIRPWLPSCFLSAAALPTLHPDLRRRLLVSLSEAAATASGWSSTKVGFFPTWVEKVETQAA